MYDWINEHFSLVVKLFRHEISVHEKISSYIFVKGIKSPILPKVQYFDMDLIGTQEETQDDKKYFAWKKDFHCRQEWINYGYSEV